MNIKVKLSMLWLFAILNYLYCDILGLMDSNLLKQMLTGNIEGMEITQGFLFAGAILMEIPIAMVLLSRILNHKANRWTNIIAGAIMTIVQIASLFLGTPTLYYLFFSIIEIATTVFIVRIAWKWRNDQQVTNS